jgi:hypothetical protein
MSRRSTDGFYEFRFASYDDSTLDKTVLADHRRRAVEPSRTKGPNQAPPLSTRLGRGSHNLFDTLPISIDSEVLSLLRFVRMYITTLPYKVILGKDLTEDDGEYILATSFALNEDMCRGYGVLAYAASTLASITSGNQEIQRVGTKLRYQAYQKTGLQVHQQVSHKGWVSHGSKVREKSQLGSLSWCIYLLMGSEMAVGNYDAAAVHAKMLRRLLQPDDSSSQTNLELLWIHMIINQDCQRTIMSVSRSIWNLEQWATWNCLQVWKQISRGDALSVKHAIPELRLLDESINNRDLF